MNDQVPAVQHVIDLKKTFILDQKEAVCYCFATIK